jgi:hypothetical protein
VSFFSESWVDFAGVWSEIRAGGLEGHSRGVDDLLSRWSSPDPLRSLWFLLDLVGDGEEMGLDQAMVEEGVADSAILGTLDIDMAVEVAMSSHRIGQRHLGLKNRKGILIRKRNPLMWLSHEEARGRSRWLRLGKSLGILKRSVKGRK